MYYVYLLQSKKTRKFYVGYTSNLKQRFNQHNNGEVQSNKYGIPYKLVYFEGFIDRKDALTREKKLKHHGQGLRRLKEKLINSIES
ncbi:MAG: GIY-YIG nuclease family protein [Balneolaceae bacterium]